MYHPGKVIKVLSFQHSDVKSGDNTTQAMLEMWDENVLTFRVDSNIASEIKDGDIVLVDYSRLSPAIPNGHLIVKILRGGTAKIAWDKYRKHHEKNKKSQPSALQKKAFEPEYMG